MNGRRLCLPFHKKPLYRRYRAKPASIFIPKNSHNEKFASGASSPNKKIIATVKITKSIAHRINLTISKIIFIVPPPLF